MELYEKKFQSLNDLVEFVTERLNYLVTARPTAVNMADFRDKLGVQVKHWAAQDQATVDSVTQL